MWNPNMSEPDLSDYSESDGVDPEGESTRLFRLRRNSDNPNNYMRYDDDNVFYVSPLLGPPENYDKNLTPAHKYLGDGLHETTGRTVFEEGVTHTIPVIFLQLNLIPGQILPIIARSPHVKFILKYALARNRVFGVSYKLNVRRNTYGTIAEIYEHSVDIDSAHSFQIKAMGHQRFRIVRVDTFPEGSDQPLDIIALARIRTIPDISLTNPYNKLCLHPKRRNSNQHSAICRKRDMWQTQWPDWVYNQFDANHLASKVADKIKMFNQNFKISDDPSLLSLQVTKLGIFSQDQVNHLLGIASANQRLQYILKYWTSTQSMQKFVCVRCAIPICSMSKVYPMSPEGPQGTYCNSWGQIHDMITVTELDEIIDPVSVGSPSTECCWFPGYKWVIILCPNCHYHLGWCYSVDESRTLVPRKFYGLSMQSIAPVTTNATQRSQPIELFSNEERLITL